DPADRLVVLSWDVGAVPLARALGARPGLPVANRLALAARTGEGVGRSAQNRARRLVAEPLAAGRGVALGGPPARRRVVPGGLAAPRPPHQRPCPPGPRDCTIQNSIASDWAMLRHPSTRSAAATRTSPGRTVGVWPASCTWIRPRATATMPVPSRFSAGPADSLRARWTR